MQASSSSARTQRQIYLGAAALALVLLGSGLWSYRQTQQELFALPSAERQSLYQHTIETLENICERTHGTELNEYCRTQAQFIARFPECGATCQEVCRRFSPRPTK